MLKRKPLKIENQKELRESLSLKIGQWAFDELGYSENVSRPLDPSSCKVFQNLCKGINGKIWESVINNVRRVKTGGSNSFDPSTSEALERYSALVEQSKMLDFELTQEISDAKNLQTTAATLQDSIDKDLNKVFHLKRMTAILETNSIETRAKALHFTQILNGLGETFEGLKKSEKEEEESFSITGTCSKIQRKTLSAENAIAMIEKSVYSLCHDHAVGKSNSEDESINKKIVTAQIVDLMKNTSLNTVTKCLGNRALEATNHATKFTNAINVGEEMRCLGYNYEAGDSEEQIVRLEDQCMEEHLANLHLKHIKIKTECVKGRNEIQTLINKKKKLEEKMGTMILDSSKRQMVLNLLNSETRAKNIRIKINTLNKLICEEINETSEDNPNLNEKLEAIEEIEHLIQQKHSSILSTMAANQEMKLAIASCFQNWQDAAATFTQMNICNLVASVEIWKEKMILATELFCTLEYKNLRTLRVSNKNIPYSKLNLFLIEQNPFLGEIKDIFGISRLQSFDSLLKRAIKQKEDYEAKGNVCAEQLDAKNKMKQFHVTQKKTMEEFQQRLDSFNDEVAKYVPGIMEAINEIPPIRAKCHDAEEQINIWWTLPAYRVKF